MISAERFVGLVGHVVVLGFLSLKIIWIVGSGGGF